MGDPEFCIEFIEKYEAIGVDEYVATLQVGAVNSPGGDEFPSSLREVRNSPLPRKREESPSFGPAGQRR